MRGNNAYKEEHDRKKKKELKMKEVRGNKYQ